MNKEITQEVFSEIRSITCKLGDNPDLEWVFQGLEHTLLYTESPIERKFMIALLEEIMDKNKGLDLWANPITIWTNQLEDLYPKDYFGKDKCIVIFINPTIGKYRPDLLISNQDINIIFELDGFQFHNTKQQLIKDKKRERELSKLGYKMYRFSGSEIHTNSSDVAKEALEIIYKEFNL